MVDQQSSLQRQSVTRQEEQAEGYESQAAISAEKHLAKALDAVRIFYRGPITLSSLRKDYDALANGVGALSGDGRLVEASHRDQDDH